MTAPVAVEHRPICAAGWAGSAPMVPQYGQAPTVEIVDGAVNPVLVVEPSLGDLCLVWASDALAGTPRDGMFGMNDAWWT